jgi:hypothetical protein
VNGHSAHAVRGHFPAHRSWKAGLKRAPQREETKRPSCPANTDWKHVVVKRSTCKEQLQGRPSRPQKHPIMSIRQAIAARHFDARPDSVCVRKRTRRLGRDDPNLCISESWKLNMKIKAAVLNNGCRGALREIQAARDIAGSTSVCVRDGLTGWGGRIRTSASRNQNSRRLSARSGRIRAYASQLNFVVPHLIPKESLRP